MNVLLLIDHLGIGGAETHVLTLAKQLSARGCHVSILSCGGRLEQTIASTPVTLLHFPRELHGIGNFLLNLQYLRRLLHTQAFDVLHAHTRMTALMLRLSPRRANRTTLASFFHSDTPPRAYRSSRLSLALAPLRVVTAHAMFRPRYRKLSYWGETTIAVSEDIRRHLITRFSLAPHQIHVIPNGIELDDSPMSKQENPPFSVVFASRLDRDCSLAAQLLLTLAPTLAKEAHRAGRTFTLTILGGGEQYEPLKAQAYQLLQKDGGQFFPPSSLSLPGATDCPMTYFRQAQVFVGVSRAALEALSCGCAVILAGNEGYGGILTEKNFSACAESNFCCRNGNVTTAQDLLLALCELLHTPKIALIERQNHLRILLRKQYDIAYQTQQTLRLYTRQLSRRRKLHLLIAGYFGKGNTGDESILRQTLRRFTFAAAPLSLATAPWPLSNVPPKQTRLLYVGHLTHKDASFCARRAVYLIRNQSFFPCVFPTRAYPNTPLSSVSLPAAVHSSPSPVVPLRLSPVVLLMQSHRDITPPVQWAGAPAVSRAHPLSVCRALTRADALLFGGGSLLQNRSRHGNRSLAFYLSLLFFARLCRCPYSLRANGIGPLDGKIPRKATGALLRHSAGISLRDAPSAALLKTCGVPQGKIAFCSDAALYIRAESKAKTMQRLRGVGVMSDSYLCICPRPMQQAQEEALIALLSHTSPHLTRVYLPLDRKQDTVVCRRLQQHCGGILLPSLGDGAAAGILRRANTVLSMRLHGLIFARTENRTPPRLIAVALPSTQAKLAAENAEQILL